LSGAIGKRPDQRLVPSIREPQTHWSKICGGTSWSWSSTGRCGYSWGAHTAGRLGAGVIAMRLRPFVCGLACCRVRFGDEVFGDVVRGWGSRELADRADADRHDADIRCGGADERSRPVPGGHSFATAAVPVGSAPGRMIANSFSRIGTSGPFSRRLLASAAATWRSPSSPATRAHTVPGLGCDRSTDRM
jgi:hypothetical protein